MEPTRCTWPAADPLMIRYHDEEWGQPTHDDRKLFEFLVLDAFQAGLSWRTILYRREAFRKAFASFDPRKVAKFDAASIAVLMEDAGIIRNGLKIKASVSNAQAFLAVQKEFGTFDAYIWQFTGGKTLQTKCKTDSDIRVTCPESDAMSADLKKRGFKFVGSTICYAFMQASGMINDHLVSCFRHKTPGKS